MRALLIILLFAACAPQETPPVPLDASTFDAQRAWDDLMHQVELGPRPAGSPALEETRTWIASELEEMGLTPIREDFQADTPFGLYRMANIYADFVTDQAPEEEADILVLCAHFDTKTLNFRFVGANDGASGVAALLELARVITAQGPRPMTYRFLFVDGEEAMRQTWVDPDNTYGSRHHVEQIAKRGENLRVRACVLLDMVGDIDLQLTRDTFSHEDLLEIFFEAARQDGLGEYVDGPPIPIKDDHLPFQRIRIPACDLIDFSYGEDNEHWHRPSDLPKNCSKESLGVIGRIVLLGLPVVEQRFKRSDSEARTEARTEECLGPRNSYTNCSSSPDRYTLLVHSVNLNDGYREESVYPICKAHLSKFKASAEVLCRARPGYVSHNFEVIKRSD